jgi:hypothetical protein
MTWVVEGARAILKTGAAYLSWHAAGIRSKE